MRLPFRPLEEALRDTPEEPLYKVVGMVAPGLVTAIAGRPKVGKTTLVFGMVKAVARGEDFLGGKTAKAKTLLLTEERELTLNEKWNVFQLTADDDVHLLMRYHADGEWPDIVEQAVRYCVENELEILVVDGWDKWSGVKDENDAVDVNKALGPLLAAAAAGLAVVIVAHQRKGGGQHGDAVRGSNAFTGAVDVILELQWATGELGEQGGRALYGNSRLMSTPEKLALIWDAETGIYTAGDLGEIEYAADKDRVVAALDTEERIQDEIADRVNGMRKERLTALLGELVDEKVAFRTGKGRKGSQFRWRRRTPEDDADEGEQTDTGEMGLSANGASEPEQNAVPATDSVPEVWERNIRLNHAGLSGSSDSVPTYREPGRERNSPRPETATQNGVPPIPNTHGDALPPSREWLARDGRWRSFTDEPPAFAGEVVDTR